MTPRPKLRHARGPTRTQHWHAFVYQRDPLDATLSRPSRELAAEQPIRTLLGGAPVAGFLTVDRGPAPASVHSTRHPPHVGLCSRTSPAASASTSSEAFLSPTEACAVRAPHNPTSLARIVEFWDHRSCGTAKWRQSGRAARPTANSASDIRKFERPIVQTSFRPLLDQACPSQLRTFSILGAADGPREGWFEKDQRVTSQPIDWRPASNINRLHS